MSTPTTSPDRASSLLVVGSANADLVVRVARHPAPGETVLGSDGLAVHLGGKGANQAVAAGRLGARVAFCGCVGQDAYGERLAAELGAAGVATTALATAADAPTGIALITVAESGENTIVVAPGANRSLTEARVRAAVTAAVRVVSVQCEVPLDAVRAAARHASRLVLNPSPPEALTAAPYAAEILAAADPLVVNEHELRVLLAGRTDRPRPADLVPLLGVRSAVVTLGAAGAVVVDGEGRTTKLPAPAVPVVDTTGAGDAFTGALAWRLAEGDELVAAARWAVLAGAAAVQEHGAQLSSTACGKLLAVGV
ncbi:ribokinase [Actinacidiphila acididurans]|uniref:Ribokinase n=1 Tax=Actinacidiphila acididurans TaxID=2784346 RepID=A0ABS2U4X5_9ACTN|nr:ribokinase [Actinacidiphila acididurans]MBM9510664.1 ribokinase [Actinacidiphila acididurans]